MPAVRQDAVLRFIRKLAVREQFARLTDSKLLDRFVTTRDEEAFAALVRRHGPMVLRVCLQVLDDEHDAEDAFQATFLVLSRKASSIKKKHSVGSWLFGVANHAAMDLKRKRARRRSHESQAGQPSATDPLSALTLQEAQTILNEELARLAEKYRAPLVLCSLEGLTRDEAAQQLGLPVGTLKNRLEQARKRLRVRLTARGLSLSAAFVASVFGEQMASAAMPPALLTSTVQAVTSVGAGSAATTFVSTQVTALAEGVLKAMFVNKLKIAALFLLALSGAGAAGLLALAGPANHAQAQAQKPERNQKPKMVVHTPPQRTGGDKAISKDGAKPEPAKPVVVRQDATLQRMAMSPDGEVVAMVGVTHDGSTFNSTVKLWDARTGKLKRALDEEKDSNLEIAFSQDLLAIGVNGKLKDTDPRGPREVRLLDAKTLKLRHKIDETLVPGVFTWSALAFSPDGKRLAVAGSTSNNGLAPFVKLWDVEKQKFIEGKADLGDIPRELNQVECLAFSPDGKLVAAGWRDGKIRLFDGRTGDFKALLDPEPDSPGHGVGGIAFSPDSKTLASTGNDNTVVLWDLTEGKPPRGERPDEKKIKQLIADLDADEFATREKASKELEKLGKSAEGTMREALAAGEISLEAKRRLERLLKNVAKGRTLKGHKGQVGAVAFSKDGRWIATSGASAKAGVYEVILWDAKTGEVKQTFAGLTEWVHVVAFSPDGKTLVVCGGATRDEGKGSLKTSGELTLLRLE